MSRARPPQHQAVIAALPRLVQIQHSFTWILRDVAKKKVINGKIAIKLSAVTSSGHLLTPSPVSAPSMGGHMLERTAISSHPPPVSALPSHQQTRISGPGSFSIPKA